MDDDTAPLPLYDDEEFFSDLGSDEVSNVNRDGRKAHRLVIDVGDRSQDARAPITTENPFGYGGTTLDAAAELVQLDNREPVIPDHCHVRKPNQDDKTSFRQLIAVTVLCMLFIIGEVVGGVYANSLALLSDATHLGSDLTSFVISIIALYLAKKPPTRNLNFGFFRVEILGAVVSVLIIWVVTAVLVYLAVERIIHQDYEINADDMLITSACGVAFNIVMALVLHLEFFNCKISHGHSHGGGGHGHSHGGGHSHANRSSNNQGRGHGHSHNRRHGSRNDSHDCDESSSSMSDDVGGRDKKKQTNIVIRAAFVHVLGDLIQSVGVLVAAFVIKYKPEWKLADPICTFLFSVLVLLTTCTVLRDALTVVLEGVPRGFNFEELQASLSEIPHVKSVHSLKVWSLTVNENVANVHIAIGEGTDSYDVLKKASHMLRTKYDIYESTIQIEQYQANIMSQCTDCLRNTGKTLRL